MPTKPITHRYYTEYRDYDSDGLWDDQTTTHQTFDSAKLIFEAVTHDWYADGLPDAISTTAFTYDGDRLVTTARTYDRDADGTIDFTEDKAISYTESGLVAAEVATSGDYDGDGAPCDLTTTISYTYDAGERLTEAHTIYAYNGEPWPYEWRSEWTTYNDAGQKTQFTVSDSFMLDFDISWKYYYHPSGRLAKITYQDEFKFGDDRFRNSETFKYDADGRVSEHNKYDTWLEGNHYLELKTQYTYWDHNGLVKSELTTAKDFSWNLQARHLVEHWYNVDGLETHTLVSRDPEADGVWNPGMRDLFIKEYDDAGRLVTETHDFNVGDGVIEYQMVSELLVA